MSDNLMFLCLFIFQEKIRENREEHVILLGKSESGINQVGNALLPSEFQNWENRNEKGSIGWQANKTKSEGNTMHLKITEVEGANDRYNRDIKITCLCLDHEKSANELSSFSIEEDYSVVYCFPVSWRFQSEDSNVLQIYLQHRQKENYRNFVVAFTYAERLEVDPKYYIANLPEELKDLLKKCENNYIFITSKDCEENNTKVKTLIKPVPYISYYHKMVPTFFFYIAPHYYFFLKFH